jgi:hypothetical protein
MQISSRSLLRTAIIFLGVMLCLGLVLSYGLTDREARALSAGEWSTVHTAVDNFITGQYQADAVDGESGFTTDAATLKGQIDSNADSTYLGEGDDAANAPVLVDVLNGGFGGMIQTTAVLGSWNTTALDAAHVNAVAAAVDAHEAAGFSTDVVVYCLTGHTESVAAGALGAVANAGGLGGSSAPNVLGLKWGRYGWNTGSHSYTKTNTLGTPAASPGYSTATNAGACNGSTPDSELVRCTAQWALSATGGNVGNGTVAGATTGYGTSQVIDLRSGDLTGASVATSGSTTQVPLNTVFNTGLTDINPAGTKKVFANRTQHTAGMVAAGAEMLGYDSSFASWGLAEYNNTIGEQKVGAGAGYGLVPTSTIDTTAPTVTVGPSAGSITDTSASISRTADEPATMKVEYGTTTGVYTMTTNDTVLNANKSVGLSGLTASTTYYVQVTSYDGAANATVSSEISFTTAAPPCTPAKPTLDMTMGNVYWASPADYTARLLSVDLGITNNSANSASSVMISGATVVPVSVTLTGTPYNVGSIAVSATGNTTVKYNVPMGVGSFSASMTGTAIDDCDATNWNMP